MNWSEARRRFTDRWPEWQAELVPLRVRELFCWPLRTVFIDAAADDPAWQLEHCSAHLEHHRDSVVRGEWFTDRQEGEASLIAALELGRFDWSSEPGAMEDDRYARPTSGES